MSTKQIKDALKNITKSDNEPFCVVATVDEVDLVNKTCLCLPIDESKADLMNVRLMSDNKTGFLIIPKVGSIVVVSFISNELTYVSMFYEVDKILLNGDNYGGLVKVQELTNKINALENLTNNILSALKGTTIPLAPTGTYPFAPLYAAFNLIAPITTKTELENSTVKHGNG